jgi:hypothetical protein
MFPKKKTAPPFGGSRSSDLDAPEPVDGPMRPAPKMPAPDAEETAEEASEDYGAKLKADIDAAGEAEGLDSGASRRLAGAMFAAAAKCLATGDSVEPNEAQADEENPDGIY